MVPAKDRPPVKTAAVVSADPAPREAVEHLAARTGQVKLDERREVAKSAARNTIDTESAISAPGMPSLPAASSDQRMNSALREEVSVLSAAKAALDRGAPSAALAAIRTYRTRFPAGHLRREATYLEMEAEHALGHRARSAALARELAFGASQSARRAREILNGDTP